MLKIKECKALARRTLAGKYKTVIGAYFINLAISCIMWIITALCVVFALFGAGIFGGSGFSFVRVLIGVMAAIAMIVASIAVGMWFDIGTVKLMLNICRGGKYKVSDVFYGFRSGSNTIGYILTGFFIWLITVGINLVGRILIALSSLVMGSDTTAGISASLILSLVFTFISIYAMICLMFAKIIIADKPTTGIAQALKKSRELMRGRMLKGAWLMYLSFIFWDILMAVCSISALWIIPYISCTTIIFYMEADGTLWQLPDPDRDKARSSSAENAAGAGAYYGNAESGAGSNTAAQDSTESSGYTDSSFGANTAEPNGSDDSAAGDNNASGTYTQKTSSVSVEENNAHNYSDYVRENNDQADNGITADVQDEQAASGVGDVIDNAPASDDSTDTVDPDNAGSSDNNNDITDTGTASSCGTDTDDAAAGNDSAAADNAADGGSEIKVADNIDASAPDAGSDAQKSDSWEQTISEMHIELPEGFNKTDI